MHIGIYMYMSLHRKSWTTHACGYRGLCIDRSLHRLLWRHGISTVECASYNFLNLTEGERYKLVPNEIMISINDQTGRIPERMEAIPYDRKLRVLKLQRLIWHNYCIHTCTCIGVRLICSKFFLLFYSTVLINFPYYSFDYARLFFL